MSILNKDEVKILIDSLKQKSDNEVINKSYIKPVLKKLTDEEIIKIHENGQITPSEWLVEMEGQYYDLCLISNESLRCKKFQNCHDCLVDYANNQERLYSIKVMFNSCISEEEKKIFIKSLK